MSNNPLSRVAVALDTPDREELKRWAGYFGPRVGVLKVGLEAFVRWGPAVVSEAREKASAVFLDLKLHDIPNTVAGAVRSARSLGVSMVTLHTGGGRAMLEAAHEAAAGEVALLGVTLLTSMGTGDLAEAAIAGTPEEVVWKRSVRMWR